MSLRLLPHTSEVGPLAVPGRGAKGGGGATAIVAVALIAGAAALTVAALGRTGAQTAPRPGSLSPKASSAPAEYLQELARHQRIRLLERGTSPTTRAASFRELQAKHFTARALDDAAGGKPKETGRFVGEEEVAINSSERALAVLRPRLKSLQWASLQKAMNGSSTQLDLYGAELRVNGAKAVAWLLQDAATPKLRNLTAMQLGWTYLYPAGAKHLARALPAAGSLQRLGLTENGLGAEGARYVLQALPKIGNLTVLDLSSNVIGSDSVSVLAQTIRKCAKLEKLSLVGNVLNKTDRLAVRRAWQSCGKEAHSLILLL
uniref:Uncharacterized protein n=1 Tax=Pyrodinium bahamense TaxID=73915 RepID=A0A7S0A3Y1_9DINO